MKGSYIGYLGLVLLQSQNIPLILKGFYGTGLASLPLASPIIVIAGLTCYLHHSLKIGKQARLYTIGNSVGILSNGIVLYLILR